MVSGVVAATIGERRAGTPVEDGRAPQLGPVGWWNGPMDVGWNKGNPPEESPGGVSTFA